jgi:hypothetical protein
MARDRLSIVSGDRLRLNDVPAAVTPRRARMFPELADPACAIARWNRSLTVRRTRG